MEKLNYVRGAAFYLFVYLFLGLVNAGLIYASTRWLGILPAVAYAVLVPFTGLVLFFGFKMSVNFFISPDVSLKGLGLGWAFHLLVFLFVSLGVERVLAQAVSNVKLFQVASVFVNFAAFFLAYWLAVVLFVEGKVGKDKA